MERNAGRFVLVTFGNDWDALLAPEFEKEYYKNLRRFLIEEYNSNTVYPSMYDLFNALKHTPYASVKAVILGQDPYHGPGQAHGLCFSVMKGTPKPPSLENIFKELEADLGYPKPNHGCLTDWADHGVLLLNAVLSVRAGEANSHKGRGWELFTDRVISLLNEREKPMVFLLWGANAKAKGPLITNERHLVLTAAHPSPLSAYNGFYGCKHFSKTNAFLERTGDSVDWTINNSNS
ncbi:MAG: uracil-DNA glycosylase [Eubacteriales bacterium]|nr:uracil-DNA glycosylase [Eubacteriales bacterium]